MGESDRALPLFAYGTLMFPEVIGSILGRIPGGHPAMIEGYGRFEVAGEQFPGLIKSDGGKVEGILYDNIRPSEWELLSAFEDDFYSLEEVTVFSSGMDLQALTYLVPPSQSSLLSDRVWDPDFFAKNHLRRFVRLWSPGAGS